MIAVPLKSGVHGLAALSDGEAMITAAHVTSQGPEVGIVIVVDSVVSVLSMEATQTHNSWYCFASRDTARGSALWGTETRRELCKLQPIERKCATARVFVCVEASSAARSKCVQDSVTLTHSVLVS